MQGYSHALTGAAGWLAITSSASAPLTFIKDGLTLPLGANLLSMQPEVALAGAVVCAGAALAPDMDHHSGTIAYSLPPFTRLVCGGVESISGGHRHGTHSLIGSAVFTLLALLASLLTIDIHGRTVALGAGVIVVPLVAFALKGLKIRLGKRDSLLSTALGPWIVSVGTAGLATYFLDYRWSWLPVAIAAGTLIHCLGDGLTVQGVPWLWPWNPAPPKLLLRLPVIGNITRIVWQPNGYFRVPVLGETSSVRETLFAALVALYVVVSVVMVGMGMMGV